MKYIFDRIFTTYRTQAIHSPEWAYPEKTDQLPRYGYALLFSAFLTIYLLIGYQIQITGLFGRVDVFFGADVNWAVGDLAVSSANHYRTNTHPFFVLMLNPIGSLLNLVIQNAEITALLMTAITGALFVCFAAALLLRLGTPRIITLLLSLVLGLSAGHLVWSTIPDVFIYDGFSLLLFVWAIYAHPRNFPLVIATALIAFGMLTTHLPIVALFYVLARNGIKWNLRKMLIDGFFFGTLVLVFGTVLSVIQDLIYPSSTLFFMPHALASRIDFIGQTVETGSIPKSLLLILYFFLFVFSLPNLIAIRLAENKFLIKVDTFSAFPDMFSPSAFSANLVWLAILIVAIFFFFKNRVFMRPIAVALLGCIVFNFLLHMNYGRPDEYFIYAAHWVILPILLIGTSFSRIQPPISKSVSVLLGVQLSLLVAADSNLYNQIFQIIAT